MLLDHTNPDSIARCVKRTTDTLLAMRGNLRRSFSTTDGDELNPLDVRLVANADGECWFATGHVQYDTTHGAACEAITLDHNASDRDVADLAVELVNGVADQLAEQAE